MNYQLTPDAILSMMKDRFGTNYRLNSAQSAIIDGICTHQKHLVPYGILAERFRLMHFISQAAHETDQFKTLEEYASGQAYEGRRDLGNTQPGDGPRFKGRGIFMLTGRYNYRTVGKRIGVDLENSPERAKEPEVSVMTAGDYWQSRDINSVASGDDTWNVEQVTRKINGGLNGYQDRLNYFMSAGTVDWPTSDTPAPPPEEIRLPDAIQYVFGEQVYTYRLSRE